MSLKYPAEHIHWRVTLESSNVAAVGWDRHKRMYVNFRSGSVYVYDGVTRQRAVATSRAKSVGEYITRVIVPNYPAVRVT